jgi:hypothetical protein
MLLVLNYLAIEDLIQMGTHQVIRVQGNCVLVSIDVQ